MTAEERDLLKEIVMFLKFGYDNKISEFYDKDVASMIYRAERMLQDGT